MMCYARWRVDNSQKLQFRDQTILQFGESWDLLATLVLLNPGSAAPSSEQDHREMLFSMGVLSTARVEGKYLQFHIDPLMRSMFKLFSTRYTGGVIRLQNLFNLRNQHSSNARAELNEYHSHPFMFASDDEIDFESAPVVVACGEVSADPLLMRELSRNIERAKKNKLYQVERTSAKSFSIVAVTPPFNLDQIDCYHPSYTFKYGNRTDLGAFGI